MGRHRLQHQSTPTSDPPTGYSELYFKADGNLYALDENGVEVQFSSGGSIAAHASTHENGGSDEISVAGLSGTLADAQTPTSHASSHQDGGADELSVAGLNGVLADEQDAGSLKGEDLTFTNKRLGCKIYYDSVAGEWKNEPLPLVPYGKVIGTDWAPTLAQLEAHGSAVFFNTSISVTSHVGNATVATLNGLSATAGDSYTVTDSGTLTAGSLPVTPGSVVYWTGSAWAYVVPGSGGYVPSGIRLQLSTTTALISPYTDGTDDGKIFGFDGTDNTGTETTAALTFTLPDAADVAQDNMFRGPIYCGNFSGDYVLTIDIEGGGTFSDGLETVRLAHDSESIQLGVVHGDIATTWMRISTVHHHLQIRRVATWASGNFSSWASVPFDTEDHAGNPDVSYWDNPTNTTRLYAAYKCEFHVSGYVCIDSTGGLGSWTCDFRILKNGTTVVAGSTLFSGNYSNEDQTITLPAIIVSLDAGDYIELQLDQTSLSGNLKVAMLEMERTY